MRDFAFVCCIPFTSSALRKGRTHSFGAVISLECVHRSDLTAAKIIPDVLDGVDTSHGVQIKLRYGQAAVDTKGIRLTRADTSLTSIRGHY